MKKAIIPLTVLSLLTIKDQAQSVTDYDGNIYDTVIIGSQVWMKENLKVTHYRNGEVIPNVSNSIAWGNVSTGARCYYNNDSATNASVYGTLYNWFAVNDNRNLCPAGWHVPSDVEWTALTDYLGGESVAGGKMKEIGTAHWLGTNLGATNESEFTALPGGYRNHDDGTFEGLGDFAYWWSATAFNSNSAWDRNIYTGSTNIYPYYNDGKGYGFSVRCLSNSQVTSLNESNNKNELQIYPNPAIDRIYIKCPQGQDIKMHVFNLVGACVFQKELKSGTNDIDVSSLPKGIYIILIRNTNLTFQQKLIIN